MSAFRFARTFEGGHVKSGSTYVVDCPACKCPRALTITKDGTLSCAGAGCSHLFAEALGMSEEAWEALYDNEFPSAGKAQTDDEEHAPKTVDANDIVEWTLERYRIGKTTDGLPFAAATTGDTARVAREIKAIRGEVMRGFRDERIANGLKGIVLSPMALTSALEAVASYAEIKEPTDVALRSAQIGDDRIVVDLGDVDGNVVEITPAGWTVAKMGPTTPLFRRSEATAPLPIPVREGSMESLRGILGLDADDPRWLIARGWLIGSLFSERARPILWTTGTMGSGKSTRARMILSMLEPTEALGKTPGKNERDDDTAARGRYLVSYDNVSTVSTSTSNWLCTLVTGGTVDRRGLYTDDGLRSASYRRTGVATSIVLPGGLLPDALERLVIVDFDRVAEADRRSESRLWAEYAAKKPEILGALFDEIVLALRNLEDVIAEEAPMPRMADYAQILVSLDRGLGLDRAKGHYAAYKAAVDTSLAERAQDDPFASAVIKAVENLEGDWKGTAEQLLGILDRIAGYDDPRDRPKWWPTSPRKIAAQLKTATVTLEHAGVAVDAGKSNGHRWISLHEINRSKKPAPASPF